MKKTVLSLAMLGVMSTPMMAETAHGHWTAEQKKDMETVIHQYLVTHPEVLIEASQVLQKRQQDQMQTEAQHAIIEQAPLLFKSDIAVAGASNGDITLVEFFDYQCVHCKKMSGVVDALIQKNKNLRVIYKEFPIFGKSSEFASKAALAAGKQGQYMAFQKALLSTDKPLNESIVLEKAKNLGLNMDQFKKDMASDAIQKILADNHALGEKIHLMGTPAFVLAYTPHGQLDAQVKPIFLPGGATEEALQSMVNQIKPQ